MQPQGSSGTVTGAVPQDDYRRAGQN